MSNEFKSLSTVMDINPVGNKYVPTGTLGSRIVDAYHKIFMPMSDKEPEIFTNMKIYGAFGSIPMSVTLSIRRRRNLF